MTSLNQILKKLREVCEAHAQVNTYAEGQKYDMSASNAPTYPLIWVVPNGGTPDLPGNLFNYRLTVFCLDKDLPGGTNQIELLSDTSLILLDIIAKLDHTENDDDFDDWNISSVSDFQPVVDGENDTVSGNLCDITITAFFRKDICNGIIA